MCMCSWFGASLVARLVKNLPVIQEAPFLGHEDPLDKG